MRFKYAFLLFILLFSSDLLAQSTYTIRGVVSDALTKEPMPFATVFFAGTTIGTTTNEKGGYQLRVNSKGTYDLIVKFIGYETYAAQVTLGAAEVSRLNIEITQGSKDLGSVVVVARKSTQWKRHFKEFEKVFLGTSVNALNAKIVNKEVLDFTYDEEKLQLTAFAYEPLLVKNSELGYNVKYFLEQFIVDYTTNVSGYYGFTSFEPIAPKNNRKKKMYERNRAVAYNGSSNHFFKSLYKNRLKEEGFVIELNSDLSGAPTIIAKQKTIMNEMLRLDPIEKFKQLTFDSYLKISYMNERESTRYISAVASKPAAGLSITSERGRSQESWILLLGGYSSIDFEENGFVRNPISFYSYGYWAFEKVADMVPIDFEPEKN